MLTYLGSISLKLALLAIALTTSLPTLFSQSSAGSYAWSELNVPAAGRRYVYTGIARNPITGSSYGNVERIVEYAAVERTGGEVRFEVSDRIAATDEASRVFYDVRETRNYTGAGEALLARSTAIPGGFGGDAPQSVAFSSGLIAPAIYVEGQTYTYDGRFTVTTLGGSERRRLTVYPLETVTVPAGTFRCVKIGLSVDFPANVIFGRWGGTYWYARNIGVVKATFGQPSGLVSYEVELQSANFPLVPVAFDEALQITAEPESVLVGAGESIRLRVLAEGADLRYAWSHNGAVLPGATGSVLTIPNATLNHDGVYRAIVSNGGGSRQSKEATVKVFPKIGDTPGKLLNLSVRAYARTGPQQLIAGMSLQGNTAPHRVLVRGAGPALASFLDSPAKNPSLTVRDTAGAVVAVNDDWGQSSDPAALTTAASSVGAFSFSPGSADAALVASFSGGNFTAAVADELGGPVLVEYYDLNAELRGGFANLSARGDTRREALIVGWAIESAKTAKLLVRAVGPSLAQFGVTDFASVPTLRVVSGNGEATNQRWSNSAQLAELRVAMRAAGAFDLQEGSADAAVIVTVSGGVFSAVVPQSSAGGIALIEVYRLD